MAAASGESILIYGEAFGQHMLNHTGEIMLNHGGLHSMYHAPYPAWWPLSFEVQLQLNRKTSFIAVNVFITFTKRYSGSLTFESNHMVLKRDLEMVTEEKCNLARFSDLPELIDINWYYYLD